MNHPKRRPKVKMGLKVSSVIRCPGHLKFVRGYECAVGGGSIFNSCAGRIEAAHVRIGTDGGIGQKPSDIHTLPLCTKHHAEQHAIGERSFEKLYKIDMTAIAEQLWKTSPHRLKYERRERP